MSEWINVARRLRDGGMRWSEISFQLGIPRHRVRYALDEQERVNTYKRVQWARAVKRARKAFGVHEAHP